MTDERLKIRLNDILLWSFAFWPFLWSCWGLFRLPSYIHGISVTSMMLYALALFFLRVQPRIPIGIFGPWILFLVVIAAENARGMTVQFKRDFPVMICGVLIGMILATQELNRKMVLRCLFWCGLIIALSVIADTVTGVFRGGFFGLFRAEVTAAKSRMTGTGGLVLYTGTAGNLIFNGLTAFAAIILMKKEKKNWILWWGVIGIFALSAVLIQKRGFLLDFAAGVLFLFILGLRKEKLARISVNRLLWTVLLILAGVTGFYVLYRFVPLVNSSVNALAGRFSGEDATLSTLNGRTQLYELAFRLFRSNKLTGIGWGGFRLRSTGVFDRMSDNTYAAHNVYIQLLCETGVIGLTAFLAAVGNVLLWACLRYRRLVLNEPDGEERVIVGAGIFLQVFFLAYCMSGNPLYDYNFLISYFIGVILTMPGREAKENTAVESRHSYILKRT